MSSTQTNPKKSSSGANALTPINAAKLISDLALMEDDSIGAFRKRWDRFYKRYADAALYSRRDELRLLWHRLTPHRPFTGMEHLFKPTSATEKLENDFEYSDAARRGTR